MTVLPAVLLAARLLLAGVFAVAGVTKLLDRAGSRRALVDFGVPRSLAAPSSVVLPLLELTVAAALIPQTTAVYGAIGALALLLVPSWWGSASVSAADAPRLSLLRPASLGAGRPGHAGSQRRPRRHGGFRCPRRPCRCRAKPRRLARPPDRFGALWSARRLARPSRLLATQSALLVRLVRQNKSTLAAPHRISVRSSSDGRRGRGAARLACGVRRSRESRTTRRGPWRQTRPRESRRRHDHTRGAARRRQAGSSWSSQTQAVSRARGSCQTSFSGSATIAKPHAGPDQPGHAGGEPGEARRPRGRASAASAETRSLSGVRRRGNTKRAGRPPDGTIGTPLARGNVEIRQLVTEWAHTTKKDEPSPLPDLAPGFTLADLDGKPVSLEEFRGKPTLVLFWNPRCGFCRRMLDDLKAWETRPLADRTNLLVV